MNLRDAAAAEAALKALYDAIGEELKAVRAGVQAGLGEAEEATGTRQIKATLSDGTVVAKISLSEPKPIAVVEDEDKFLAWVREHHPGEVERRFITTVRPAFRDQLLTHMAKAGAAEVVDTETGVVEAVPGVELHTPRERSHSLRFEKGGREALAAAWRSGALPIPGIAGPPAIEPPEHT